MLNLLFFSSLSPSSIFFTQGKVMILATIHIAQPPAWGSDGMPPIPQRTQMTWVSCKDFRTAQELKKNVYLKNPANLPPRALYAPPFQE